MRRAFFDKTSLVALLLIGGFAVFLYFNQNNSKPSLAPVTPPPSVRSQVIENPSSEECKEGAVETQTCQEFNGSGKKQRNCIHKKWTAFNSCQLSSCASSFVLKNNSCVKVENKKNKLNSPNSSLCVGESFTNCTDSSGRSGRKMRTCLKGKWVEDNFCSFEVCLKDELLHGHECIKDPIKILCPGSSEQDCPIANGQGKQFRSCFASGWSSWGKCELISCNKGYSAFFPAEQVNGKILIKEETCTINALEGEKHEHK